VTTWLWLWPFDLISIGGGGIMMNYSCAKFGDFSFSRFGFIMRINRQTETHRHGWSPYSRHYTVGVSNNDSWNNTRLQLPQFFNVRQYYCARYWYRLPLDVCLSVCPSVTRWYCVETAQPIVKLSSLPGSPMILVTICFLRLRLRDLRMRFLFMLQFSFLLYDNFYRLRSPDCLCKL